jgi:hypothetical protein
MGRQTSRVTLAGACGRRYYRRMATVAVAPNRGRAIAQALVACWLACHFALDLVLYAHWGVLDSDISWDAWLIASALVGLLPGLALGGWKAISVATGRSTIQRRRDVIWVAVFGIWTVGWSLISLAGLIRVW